MAVAAVAAALAAATAFDHSPLSQVLSACWVAPVVALAAFAVVCLRLCRTWHAWLSTRWLGDRRPLLVKVGEEKGGVLEVVGVVEVVVRRGDAVGAGAGAGACCAAWTF